MRKSLLALPLFVALGGCAGTTAFVPVIGPAIQAGLTIPSVRDATMLLCKFNPVAQDVAALLNANPWVATAGAFADMICNGLKTSVAKLGVRRGTAPGVRAVSNVNGVRVHGKFVQ